VLIIKIVPRAFSAYKRYIVTLIYGPMMHRQRKQIVSGSASQFSIHFISAVPKKTIYIISILTLQHPTRLGTLRWI
jgi:hypothetical protein